MQVPLKRCEMAVRLVVGLAGSPIDPEVVLAPSPADKSTACGRLGDVPERRNSEISGAGVLTR
jgi:hypothetical protein